MSADRDAVAARYAEHLTDAELGLVGVARLQRATGLRLRTASEPVTVLLEELAGRSYERAGGSVPPAVVAEPGTARRVLTLVADRYLS